MSGCDIQRYKKLIQFTLDDNDIESILQKIQQPVNSASTFNRRKLLLLLNNPSHKKNLADVIDKHQIRKQKQNQNQNAEAFSDVPLKLNLNNNLLINMKKLFFYRNFSPLTNWEVISLIKFHLPENVKSDLLKNDINSCKSVVLLRSIKINPKQNEYYDCYPFHLKILSKQKDYSNLLPREILRRLDNIKERANYPTSLNELILDEIKLNNGISNISFNLLYNSKSMPDSDYYLQIVASEEVPDEEIVDEILKKPKRSVNQFMNELKKYLTSDDDLKIEKVRVILQSSVFIRPIEIPFRGKNCTHLMPDDLKSYIKINRIREDWKCKICNMSCNPDEIIIDQFYIDLLDYNPNSIVVDIYENGNFEIVEEVEIENDSQDGTLIDENPIKCKRPHL